MTCWPDKAMHGAHVVRCDEGNLIPLDLALEQSRMSVYLGTVPDLHRGGAGRPTAHRLRLHFVSGASAAVESWRSEQHIGLAGRL